MKEQEAPYTLRISFRFKLETAVQAMAYLLEQIGTTDKAKLMKLVYLADREHFIRFGFPITGDRLCALKHGPVPSFTLDALNGDFQQSDEAVFQYLHVDDHQVTLRQAPGASQLSPEARETLEQIVRQHGHKETWNLVAETHRLPEYVDSYVEGTSKTIPYERIAKASGNADRFRLNRPVISAETAARLSCPFPADPDL
jgi:uncharacterized phage-associated protein